MDTGLHREEDSDSQRRHSLPLFRESAATHDFGYWAPTEAGGESLEHREAAAVGRVILWSTGVDAYQAQM